MNRNRKTRKTFNKLLTSLVNGLLQISHSSLQTTPNHNLSHTLTSQDHRIILKSTTQTTEHGKKSKYTNLQLKSRHERSEPNPFEKEKEKHKTTYGFAKLKASLDEFAAATSGDDDLHLSSFLSFKIYNEKYEMGSAIYL